MCGTTTEENKPQDTAKVVDQANAVAANDGDSIPTKMDIFYDFNGSLGFAIGSSGFILAMYFENWLPYFRYGSLAWIWGSVLYTVPLIEKLIRGNGPWDIGDWGEFLCYVFYTIGCVFGGFFNAETVERFLPAINHTFVYGSFSLAIKPTYQLILYLLAKIGVRSTNEANESSSSSATIPVGTDDNTSSSKDEKEAPVSATLSKIIFWDWIFELGAMFFFCAAGVFGGVPPHPSLALPGVYFWEVGSFFSVARSFSMVSKRNEILKLSSK